ncbi:hypothetical protein HHK36_012007 [Tetracentron sinense]|uniref:Uncharacterized protein n=1 Tax=Tetracentron sinense TaxID=13715 RepID=A0A834ZCI4_TETSI|nr:hypothetical protein HHK36_012007 [Tetracentron sinense]
MQKKPTMAALDSSELGNNDALKISEENGCLGESQVVNIDSINNEQKMISLKRECFRDGHVNPKTKRYLGGWKSGILLLVNQGLATLAFFGVGVNLVLFLTRVLEQDNADAANNGLVMLSLTSWLSLIKPEGCGGRELACTPTSSVGVGIFYLSIYLVAFGYGGHQPTIATFGADQFDEMDPKYKHSKASFFCFFYFALNVGSLFSNTILVYFEDSGKWTLGFWVSTCSAIIALILFWLGTPGYRYIKPCGNPLPRVAQVIVAVARKWDIVIPTNGEKLYEVEGSESAIKGSRKILHSNEFRFLDKAATMTTKDIGGQMSPWRICTVTQVEEVKCVLKMLPIWLCTIIYSVVFTQMASLFVEQGAVMNSDVGNFHVPAASMSAFDICSVLVFTGIYRQIVVPFSGRLTSNSKGITELQRMGVGLVIGVLAMVAAAITELGRLKRVVPGYEISSLSIFWQIPQYVLVGASEVFMYVGQLEFFNAQSPDGIKSFGSSLCMASISFGNYVSSMLVNMVMVITTKGNRLGWIPDDLNFGHIDRFYFLIAALTSIDFVLYLFCAKWYKPINLEDSEREIEMEGQADDVLRRV